MMKKNLKVFRGSLVGLLSLGLTGPGVQAGSPIQNDAEAVLKRLEAATVLPLTEWRFAEGHIVGAHAPEFDDSSWRIFRVGEEWSTGPAWFRRVVEIPATFGGYDIGGARLRLRIRIAGENPVHLTVYLNGVKKEEGNDLDPLVLTDHARSAERLVIAVRANVPGGRTWLYAGQVEVEAAPSRPDPGLLLQELMAARQILPAIPEGRSDGERALAAALQAIDLAALDRGDQKSFDHSLERAREALTPLRALYRRFAIRAVGNSHIDLAWLWPWTESVEVVRNTFTTVLHLMDEFPEFRFTHGAAQTYAWMEEKYPRLFEQIRRRVQEGRWEVIGGSWVESDMNLPHGESLVRQLLYGTRYFQEKFGVSIRVGWNPDAFGYNWQLPQILKKSGMDFFVTQKIFWNEVTKFPHRLFWWEAPDGSRVLTYFPHHYGNPIEPVPMARDVADFAAASGHGEYMHLYGVGDHGGGPTRSMLETARRWQRPDVVYPRLFFGTVQGFFDRVMEDVPRLNLPVWRDELYLETHRGTYTSQAETKKNNRRNEALLLTVEKFSAFARLSGQEYPQADLEGAWKKLLFNQFHDILPGSSIRAVYRDADRDHAEIRRIGTGLLHRALEEISGRIDTRGPGVAVVVFNPLSWARTDVVETTIPLAGAPATVVVQDPNGRVMLAQVIERRPDVNRVRIRFIAEDVPPLGSKVFHIVPGRGRSRPQSSLAVRGWSMENEYLRITIDPTTGCLTNLYDKVNRREALDRSGCGNLLQAFYDKPQVYDAWNIDANFEDRRWDLRETESVTVTERGPVRAVIRIVKRFQNSRFVQHLILYPKIPRLDCLMEADWREKHTLLKVAFAVAVRARRASFEIPFGAIDRPTTRETPAEQAKFEVPAHHWADLSDSDYGVSLLNDSKYGYDVRDNVIRLSLLRSPAYPDPHADEGRHLFTYSVYPHAGNWKQGRTVLRGYELNHPLLAHIEPIHAGSLPSVFSFLRVEPDTVVVTAVKKAEDGEALILRFYEYAGVKTDVTVTLPAEVAAAEEVNLMEKSLGPVRVSGRTITVTTGPFEIKTVKIALR